MRTAIMEKIGEVTFEMILVEGGTFLMGDDSEEAFDREQPVHEVRVPDFYIGKYLITQRLWQEVMKENPSRFQGTERPVEGISWQDVQLFIEYTNRSYRLLTEAEWEYAARGGNQSRGYKYAGSNKLKDVGWYYGNSYGETKPVGLKYPNELGIYDMSGNVFEWVEDPYKDFTPPIDNFTLIDQEDHPRHVLRSGSWYNDARRCRVSYRAFDDPTFRSDLVGFRLGLSH